MLNWSIAVITYLLVDAVDAKDPMVTAMPVTTASPMAVVRKARKVLRAVRGMVSPSSLPMLFPFEPEMLDCVGGPINSLFKKMMNTDKLKDCIC